MEWGEFEINVVSDGALWLDGGAMYGVVPRALWSKATAPDAQNRIEVALNCLLVQTPAGNVLLDTGIGDKHEAKFVDHYKVDRSQTLLMGLQRLGLAPENIDMVINSHWHFDHAGGNSIRRMDGQLAPTFPRARYIVQRGEREYAQAPNERSRASYLPENWEPLETSGQIQTVEGNRDILPGLSVFRTPGHLRDHQSVRIKTRQGTLVFLSDAIPTPHHLPLPWIMSYDLFPVETLETKRWLIRQALAEGWLLAFYHDTSTPLGYLVERAGRLSVEPVPPS